MTPAEAAALLRRIQRAIPSSTVTPVTWVSALLHIAAADANHQPLTRTQLQHNLESPKPTTCSAINHLAAHGLTTTGRHLHLTEHGRKILHP